MRMIQHGDKVQLRYEKRFEDGSIVSSRTRGKGPLEVTAGIEHPRLPGLGSSLIGLGQGGRVTLAIAADQAHGPLLPKRIHRLARTRFPDSAQLVCDQWVRLQDGRGRSRLVRIVEVCDQTVTVDTNHPRAGQNLEVDLEVVSIQDPLVPDETCTVVDN